MQLSFTRIPQPCLRQLKREVKHQEVTQEIRLNDSMPDIGKVLMSWGQVMIRGKEWHSREMGVSAGVLAFVLYQPEDSLEVQCVEAWMPFQMKWELPETQRDGSVIVYPLLQGVDARSVSARKLMVRSQVSMMGEGWEPWQVDLCAPENVPADVQLLKRSYPVLIPKEAGEKTFELDESLEFGAEDADLDQILRYSLQPEIIDRKVMAGKVVFRGCALLHILYRTEDGDLRTKDFEIPFSQYTDLEHQYEEDSETSVMIAVTAVELEREESGNLHLQAGLMGQYVVFDRPLIELVEDAYSNIRDVKPIMDNWDIQVVLDMRGETVRAQVSAEVQQQGQLLDAAFYPAFPKVQSFPDGVEAQQHGLFQGLCAQMQGGYASVSGKWEREWQIPSASENAVQVDLFPSGLPGGNVHNGQIRMQANVRNSMTVYSCAGLPMVTGLELGDSRQSDRERPSLILRRMGDDRLWDVAKRCGSTVESIQKANNLTGEPEEGCFLLIPVQ